ncbi:MAG: aminotransferase class V-fold PLP-dependent enzyme [Blautia wexlerae]
MQVYADNAATTRMHQTAIDTMTYHLNHTFGNPSSLYTIGQEAKEVLETARATLAAWLEPSRARSTYSGGSEADNQAIILRRAASARSKGKSTSFPPRLSTTPCCTP